MAHAQKLDLVFQRNGRVHLYRRGCQFSRLLAAEVCGSAVVMLDRPCPIQCTTVLATSSIRLFPLHFSTCAFPCAIRFRFCSNIKCLWGRQSSYPVFLISSLKSCQTKTIDRVSGDRKRLQLTQQTTHSNASLRNLVMFALYCDSLISQWRERNAVPFATVQQQTIQLCSAVSCNTHPQHSFLGAFAKLRKATIGFIMSVCPSVALSVWNNSAPTGIWYLNCSPPPNICLENSSFIKPGRYVARRPIYIFDHISRKMFQTKVVEKIKTYIVSSITIFPKIVPLWDKVEKYYRVGQATEDSVVHAHCMLNTQLKYVILIAFHCKNGCTNALRRCCIRSLPLLIIFILDSSILFPYTPVLL